MIALLLILTSVAQTVVTPVVPRVVTAASLGGVEREFGGTTWAVSPWKNRTLVVSATTHNPYRPAFMFVSVVNGKVNVTGPASVLSRAAATVAEIKALGSAGVTALYTQAMDADRKR